MVGQSIVLGYIKEPFIHGKNMLSIRSHNRAKIFALGRMDDFPPLNSTLFSQTGENETYSNSLIYFGGSFKEIESFWEDWLEKFENLLKELIWESVLLKLETSFFGESEYRWQATDKIISTFDQEFPQRVTEWHFSGEPRSFQN
jgi:hypothetical protein